MKRIFFIFLICLVFAPAHAQMDNPLKKGRPNTVTLPNGEVIYDLNGEWDAVFDNKQFGKNEDIIKITQVGNKFVGIKLIGNQWVGKGSETMKGELKGDGFKSIYGYNVAHGWTLGKGEISEGGNKIVTEEPIEAYGYTAVVTLTRK